jgi:hypothetical protein
LSTQCSCFLRGAFEHNIVIMLNVSCATNTELLSYFNPEQTEKINHFTLSHLDEIMNIKTPSSNHYWNFESYETETIQSKKLAPKIPQLYDAECISHPENRNAKHRISLQPRKYPVQNCPSSTAAVLSPTRKYYTGMPLLESQATKVKLLDNSQYCFSTPKPTTSCSIHSSPSKHVRCFPALPMRQDLSKGMNFALLPRPSLKPRVRRRSREVTIVEGIRRTPTSHVEFLRTLDAVFKTPNSPL